MEKSLFLILCMALTFLRYHGPFGIVAGTNGSGKSEMMQSWILSLATKFSPQELSFIIIDYKRYRHVVAISKFATSCRQNFKFGW